MTATAPALPINSYALLDGEHVVIVQGLPDPYSGSSWGTVPLYRLDTQARLRVDPARLTVPTGSPTVTVTEAQRIVSLYRFNDVATDADDQGAQLTGNQLWITNPLEALITLDSAAELCDDGAECGMPGRKREAAVTRRLRAKVLAAILAAN